VFIVGLDMQGRCLSEYEANGGKTVREEWCVIDVDGGVLCARKWENR